MGRSAMSGIGVDVDRDRKAGGRAGGRPRKERTGTEGTREEERSRDVNVCVSSRQAMSGTRAAAKRA
jgi:hypothetical protein